MADSLAFDVAIIGAGIAGGALALALTGEGLSIALVEAREVQQPALPTQWSVRHFDPRVSALAPRSRALLDQLGVWETIAAYRSCNYHHMTVWDAEGTGQIEFDRSEVDTPALGTVVENRAIVGALIERACAAGDIHVFSQTALASITRVSSGHMALALHGGGALQADLVVAADGALSPVRGMMDFRTREWDYGHRGVVATVQVERPHEATAWQRFLPGGPLALLPLPGTERKHFCSIVWSMQEERADEVLSFDDTAFCDALGRASEWRLGDVVDSSQRLSFPLRQRHAVDYVQAGIALVGDAAHTIHPLAGQGINLGLLDVAALAREVLRGTRQGVRPGQLELLRRYQRQRKAENLLMMSAMDGFKRLFEQESLPLRWLRNTGMRAVDQMLPLKQRLMQYAMGLR
ncbi:MAG: UbiH/UbiF/VisC/COQ6 family ubiquinone biosynthesis hydroxylase [Halioglobus sp.]|nr:UbiH/UbiF/VisC/COQ6 family ubiquinone biosynthesis hydroxylase [Halioglobus sp.]